MSESPLAEARRRDRVLAALPRIEEALVNGDEKVPAIIDKAIEMFHDDSMETFVSCEYDGDGNMKKRTVEQRKRVTEKGKLVILNTLARLAAVQQQVLADKGLGKYAARKIENHLHLTKVDLGLTHDDYQRLPADLREKLLAAGMKELRGETAAP